MLDQGLQLGGAAQPICPLASACPALAQCHRCCRVAGGPVVLVRPSEDRLGLTGVAGLRRPIPRHSSLNMGLDMVSRC